MRHLFCPLIIRYPSTKLQTSPYLYLLPQSLCNSTTQAPIKQYKPIHIFSQVLTSIKATSPQAWKTWSPPVHCERARNNRSPSKATITTATPLHKEARSFNITDKMTKSSTAPCYGKKDLNMEANVNDIHIEDESALPKKNLRSPRNERRGDKHRTIVLKRKRDNKNLFRILVEGGHTELV